MHYYLDQWGLPSWTWNIIVVLGTILLGLLVSTILSLFAKKEQAKAKNEMQQDDLKVAEARKEEIKKAATKEQEDSHSRFALLQSLIKHLSRPISILIPLFLFNSFIPLLDLPPLFLRRLAHGTEIALIVCTAWTLICGIHVMQDIVHHKVNIDTPDNLRQRRIITQLMYVRRVVASIIIIVAIGAVLLTFSSMRKIGTGLLTSVGIGGIIIGFAAQRSLGNLLAGFQIAFTQPIRIDDIVTIEGEFGEIEEITLTYVVVKIWDDRRLILPINYFIEKPFQNWTRTTADTIGTIFWYVDYRFPVEWARQQFMSLVNDHPLWDKKAAGFLVTDIKQDVMELRGSVSSRNSGENWDLRCFLREEMMKRIVEHYPEYLPTKRFIAYGAEGTALQFGGQTVSVGRQTASGQTGT